MLFCGHRNSVNRRFIDSPGKLKICFDECFIICRCDAKNYSPNQEIAISFINLIFLQFLTKCEISFPGDEPRHLNTVLEN